MTTIWVPTPIESVEQISLLPDSAILVGTEPGELPIALVRGGEIGGMPVWEVTGSQSIEYEARLMTWGVRWAALLPIEVEAETLRHRASGRQKTVYVTPWQPLTSTNDPGDDADALADCGDQA
jgi:hypothetical protein